MNQDYKRCQSYWDQMFTNEDGSAPSRGATGNETFDQGLDWVCQGTRDILDFGCGNGTLLMMCAYQGTQNHTGIDFSAEGIACAWRRAAQMKVGTFQFLEGSLEVLDRMESESMDAALCINILDNLYPEDVGKLLQSVHRILRPHGKLLVQLNPWLTPEQIQAWDVRVIQGNLLDDGLLLWNRTTEDWQTLLSQYFHIQRFQEAFYPAYEQTTRLFWLTK